MNTQQLDPTTIQLPADLTLGPVHLIVADLQRALDWKSPAADRWAKAVRAERRAASRRSEFR